jgi:hypothetical protein
LAPRRSDGHPGLVAFVVMALIAGGGFAGWKYWWLPNHPAQAAASAVATPDTTKRSGTSSPAKATNTPPTAAPKTDNRQPTTPVDSPLVALDRNADSVATLTDIYKARVQANQTGCPGLGLALVAVEEAWTRYNVGKRKAGSLDGTRFLRDQQLYASVDTVERDFDRSGCTRP